MTHFLTVKARYLELVRQSDDLLSKVSRASPSTRITFDTEVNALDLAMMKLAKIIRKTPSIQDECRTQIDLEGLKGKVTGIIELIHETPPDEPISRVALEAFQRGAFQGALHGVAQRNRQELPDQEVEPEQLVLLGKGVKPRDIAEQRVKTTEAQKQLEAALLARAQAQENTKQAYTQTLKGVNISAFPPDISINVGDGLTGGSSLVQAKILETAANTRYNEALATFAQEQANQSRLQREFMGETPKPESRGVLEVVWDGVKWSFGLVFNLFSVNY